MLSFVKHVKLKSLVCRLLSFLVTVVLVLPIFFHCELCISLCFIVARVRQIATEANRVKVDYDTKYAEKLKKIAEAYVISYHVCLDALIYMHDII